MPIGAEKAALMAAAGGVGGPNYFGDGSLGTCQFGASSITQTGDSVAIDTVLSTGSESGGPGSSSYGTDVPNSSACYELTVLNTDGAYDGDMFVANFSGLTVDASVTLTTDQPCRGILCYVKGDCTINGALSMSARGGFSDPTATGGSDSAVVDSDGLQLGLVTNSGSETLVANTFAGCGDAAVAAVGNQDALDSNGSIFTMSKLGGAGATSHSNGAVYSQRGNSGVSGATGANTISTGGGGSGGAFGSTCCSNAGTGGAGGAFSGGAGSGAAMQQNTTANSSAAGNYGGAGGAGSGNWGTAGGAGNPGVQYNGVGGIIWLLVDGDLTIGAAGTIEADGVKGKEAETNPGSAGAGSGGGSVMVLYTGTLTNNGAIQALKGNGGGSQASVSSGGHGGAGGVQSAQVEGT